MDIAKLGRNPELYSATFTASGGSGDGRKARTFTGREELGQFLEQAGVPQEQITSALRRVHEGLTTSIPNVVIDDRRLQELGLQTSSGTAAHPEGGAAAP